MKKITLLAFAALLCCSAFSQNFDLVSPSGLVKVQIGAAPNLTWQLFLRDKPLTQPAQLTCKTTPAYGCAACPAMPMAYKEYFRLTPKRKYSKMTAT